MSPSKYDNLFWSMGADNKMEAAVIRAKFRERNCYREKPPLFLLKNYIYYAFHGEPVKCSDGKDLIELVQKIGIQL